MVSKTEPADLTNDEWLGSGNFSSVRQLEEPTVGDLEIFSGNEYSGAFDGTDDYVEVNNLSISLSTYTVEAWVKTDDISRSQRIVALENNSVLMRNTNSNWQFYTADSGFDNIITIDVDATGYNDTWVHLAQVLDDANDELRAYIDGTLVGQTSVPTDFVSDQTGKGAIGSKHDQTDNYFSGYIDEVRVWSVARSQTEIDNSRNGELVGDEAGLENYYSFEYGTDTTVYDRAGSVNGTKSGMTWSTDTPFSTGNHQREGHRISNPIDLDSVDNVDSSNINWNADEPTNTNVNIHTAITNDTTEPTWNKYSLDFNGTDEYVEVPHDSSISFSTPFTVEAWIYPRDFGTETETILGKTNPDNTTRNYEIRYNNNTDYLEFVVWDDDAEEQRIASVTAPATNEWTHVSARVNSSYYPEIALGGSSWNTGPNQISTIYTGTDPFVMGSYNEGSLENTLWYDGIVDEVRLWAAERSLTQINDNKTKELDGNETDLAAYYNLETDKFDVADCITDNAGDNDGKNFGATISETVPFDDFNEETADSSIEGISSGQDLTGKYLWVLAEEETDDVTTTPTLNSFSISVTQDVSKNYLNIRNQSVVTGRGRVAHGLYYIKRRNLAQYSLTDTLTAESSQTTVDEASPTNVYVEDKTSDETMTVTDIAEKTEAYVRTILPILRATRIHTINLTRLGGARNTMIWWDSTEPSGTDITVQASLDGSAWTDCTSGSSIPIIADGDDVTGKTLYIKEILFTDDNTVTPELNELTVEAEPGQPS